MLMPRQRLVRLSVALFATVFGVFAQPDPAYPSSTDPYPAATSPPDDGQMDHHSHNYNDGTHYNQYSSDASSQYDTSMGAAATYREDHYNARPTVFMHLEVKLDGVEAALLQSSQEAMDALTDTVSKAASPFHLHYNSMDHEAVTGAAVGSISNITVRSVGPSTTAAHFEISTDLSSSYKLGRNILDLMFKDTNLTMEEMGAKSQLLRNTVIGIGCGGAESPMSLCGEGCSVQQRVCSKPNVPGMGTDPAADASAYERTEELQVLKQELRANLTAALTTMANASDWLDSNTTDPSSAEYAVVEQQYDSLISEQNHLRDELQDINQELAAMSQMPTHNVCCVSVMKPGTEFY